MPERGSADYDVEHYDLTLSYSIMSNRLDGRAAITVVPIESLKHLTLDLSGLVVTKVMVDGRSARWQQRGDKLRVTPTAALRSSRRVDLDIRYKGNPGPTSSVWGPVGWEELTDGVLVASQPSGASTWFPCNDLARQKATYRIRVTTGAAYRVLVNGVLRSRQASGSTITWDYEQAEPTSPYLMAVNIGRYEERVLADGPVGISGAIDPDHRDEFDVAFGRLPEMMDVFVDRFGPYPFAADYAVVLCAEPLEIPIEAQGQAMFGTNHLNPRYQRLIAHELAHQWFGNSVTAASWRDVWLHEGFACYAEWIWSEESGSESAASLARTHHDRLAGLPQDLVIGDPGAADMFDDRVYKRGALLLHTVRGVLGDDAFFGLLRRWTATYRHGLVTSAEFEQMAAAVAGQPLDDVFTSWLRRADLPTLP